MTFDPSHKILEKLKNSHFVLFTATKLQVLLGWFVLQNDFGDVSLLQLNFGDFCSLGSHWFQILNFNDRFTFPPSLGPTSHPHLPLLTRLLSRPLGSRGGGHRVSAATPATLQKFLIAPCIALSHRYSSWVCYAQVNCLTKGWLWLMLLPSWRSRTIWSWSPAQHEVAYNFSFFWGKYPRWPMIWI